MKTIFLLALMIPLTVMADNGRLGITLGEAEKIWGKSTPLEKVTAPADKAVKFKKGNYYIQAQLKNDRIVQVKLSRSMDELSEEEIKQLCVQIGGKGNWPEKGFRRVRADKMVVLQILGFNKLFRFRTAEFDAAVTKTEKEAKKKAINDL